MSITITLTYATPEQAIAALAKLEAKPEKEAAAPVEKSKPAATTASPAPGPRTAEAAVAAAPEKTAAEPSPAAASAEAQPQASTAVTFDELKKAFLGLSTKAGGRALCESVLSPFKLAKLSEAKPEQYGDILGLINKAGA